MGYMEKFRAKGLGRIAAISFYVISGVVCLAVLSLDPRMVHMAIIGGLSLLTAFCLFRKLSLFVWFTSILFFTVTAFSATMLYYGVCIDIILAIAAAVYLILTWVFTGYTISKRKIFTK
ncbi:MAG: hypothetical protein RMK50_06090 [Nitrososphaerota archaeon]|nr:hypothetical protein [Candidatus Bathyarchaeota archaeon]MDW8194373.1 hypothetical protein [Nitrososphaerota archaeon]